LTICTAKNGQNAPSLAGGAGKHGYVGVRRREEQQKLDDAAIWADCDLSVAAPSPGAFYAWHVLIEEFHDNGYQRF